MNLNQFYHYYKSKSGGGVPNFLKATEDFDSSIDWNKLPSTDAPTVSGGITDPNGGSDAQRINFTDNRQARVQQRVSLSASTQYTFSVYARVNTGTEQFRLRNVTLAEAEAKTATTSWTRFEYTFTTTTGGNYDLSIQNTSNDAKTIEFWGAMLNVGASANDYVKVDPSISGSTPTPAYSGFGDTYGDVTAYYSLRKFTEAETLNAIRVRRSSDDAEQDIGFDANGDLDTTALLAFVNADVDVYTSDFSSTENLSEFNGTGAAAQSVGGVDDAYKFTLSGGNVQHTAFTSSNTLESGKSFTVVFDYYIPSGQTLSSIVFDNIGGSGAISGSLNVTDNWTTETINFTADGSRPRWWAGAFATNVNGDGDVFYLKNIVVTQTTADGAVTTFYDQSGNGNNATNSTESEQPLIVDGGTLVTENGKAAIDFDGVDDFFGFTTPTTLSDEFFITSVLNSNPSGTFGTFLHSQTVATDRARLFPNGDIVLRLSGSSLTYASAYTTNTQELLSIERDSSDNLVVYVDGTSKGTKIDGDDWTGILGCLGSDQNQTSGQFFTGTFQEIIVFNSDQTTNRTGIESNINDHFSIYP